VLKTSINPKFNALICQQKKIFFKKKQKKTLKNNWPLYTSIKYNKQQQ
jgi:hypothetical protein